MDNRSENERMAAKAQDYAREVADAMLEIRGYGRKKAPREVVDDVFATMGRHDRLYTWCFSRDTEPQTAATLIQDEEWGF